jgi:hypothetical protein
LEVSYIDASLESLDVGVGQDDVGVGPALADLASPANMVAKRIRIYLSIALA